MADSSQVPAMHVKGYMVEATYENGVLTAHASNKMARFAMAAQIDDDLPDDEATQARIEEEGKGAVLGEHVKGQVQRAFTDDLVLRRDQIAGVELKEANIIKNGQMTITTTTGKRHILHFRRKQRGDFHALADALRAPQG